MLLDLSNGKSNLPDILILGAAKSGTTSLAFYLKQHPDVFMPRKEPGFFAYYNRPLTEIPSGIRDRQIVDLSEYTSLYSPVGKGQKICDSSVAQLTNHEYTLRNIEALYGDRSRELSTFIILRNPVDRAFSHYLMFVKNEIENLSFEEAINEEVAQERRKVQLGFDYIGGSMYADRVRDILKALPQTKVYLTSDLKKPEFLADFLEACYLRSDVEINTSARLNPSGIPKKAGLFKMLRKKNALTSFLNNTLSDKQLFKLKAFKSRLVGLSVERVEIDPALKRKLMNQYFKADLKALENLIDRDLSMWYDAHN